MYEETCSIILRNTQETDLDFVVGLERKPENALYVGQWTKDRHLQALADSDISHLIIEETASSTSIGYIIMAGLKNPSKSIELRRIVVGHKGKGYGKETLIQIKRIAFEELHAHRLWLDVRLKNMRAQHVYESQGFKMEGLLRECIFCNGEHESLIVMSILKNEYRMDQSCKRNTVDYC